MGTKIENIDVSNRNKNKQGDTRSNGNISEVMQHGKGRLK